MSEFWENKRQTQPEQSQKSIKLHYMAKNRSQNKKLCFMEVRVEPIEYYVREAAFVAT